MHTGRSAPDDRAIVSADINSEPSFLYQNRKDKSVSHKQSERQNLDTQWSASRNKIGPGQQAERTTRSRESQRTTRLEQEQRERARKEAWKNKMSKMSKSEKEYYARKGIY